MQRLRWSVSDVDLQQKPVLRTDVRAGVQIWTILFQRLQAAKTARFVRGFLVFLSHYVVKRGPVALQASTDTVQPGIFLVILQQARMDSSLHVCSSKISALTYPLRRSLSIMSIIGYPVRVNSLFIY